MKQGMNSLGQMEKEGFLLVYLCVCGWVLFLSFFQDEGTCCCCLVVKSCPTLCDPMDCSTPGSSVLRRLPACAQTHVHPVGDAS